jgi:hypothetical protein
MDRENESDFRSVHSFTSLDEDEVNCRVNPHWPSYVVLIESRGFRLDTVRDVKDFYERYGEQLDLCAIDLVKCMPSYSRACEASNDNALCKDPGLVCLPTLSV